MGRNAKSINLHVLEGNRSRKTKEEIVQRQQAEESIKFKSDKVTPPKWLSKEAKKIFNLVKKEFESNELLVNVDVHNLAFFADVYSNYIECSRIIERDGMMVEYTNKSGETQMVPHQLLPKKKQFFEQMSKIMGEFGLSPVARAKLAIGLVNEKGQPENKFSDRV